MMTCLRWILGYLRLHGAKSASLETDAFVQCYELVVVHATIGLDCAPSPRKKKYSGAASLLLPPDAETPSYTTEL